MKTNLFQTIKHWLLMWVIAFSVVFAGLYFTAKSRLPDTNWLTAQSGDVLTADKWNNLVPNTMVGAFLASTCPTWWKPADGTNWTTDLRWIFLRGLNSFDGGSTTNVRDPDCASRTWWCAIWSYQTDSLQNHQHWRWWINSTANVWWLLDVLITKLSWTTWNLPWWVDTAYPASGYSAPRIADETRGKNIAVIFCVRK